MEECQQKTLGVTHGAVLAAQLLKGSVIADLAHLSCIVE